MNALPNVRVAPVNGGRSFIGAVDPKRASIFQAETDQSPVAARATAVRSGLP
jgi:hypothetical protein